MSVQHPLDQSLLDSFSINFNDAHTERSSLNAQTNEPVAIEETENTPFAASLDSGPPHAQHGSRRSATPRSIEHPTFADRNTARLGPPGRGYASVETREIDNIRPSNLNSWLLSSRRTSMSDEEISQTADPSQAGACPTALTRSTYQRWFSTPLDILISLVPLLFLGEWLDSICAT